MAFDPNLYFGGQPAQSPGTALASGSAAPPPAQAPASTSFDPERYFNDGHATDPTTGATIPLKFSGNTPDTAKIMDSPISMADRLKMSMGNEVDNAAYLKSKFEDVKPMTGADGKPTGDLAVKQGGTWYQVNPKTGEAPDSWTSTRDYLKQLKQIKDTQLDQQAAGALGRAPSMLGAGVAAGVDALTGGLGTAASGAIAGAASAGIKTSLGRIVGTYQATPGETAYDMGIESLLTAAGAKILPGVKPTASWIADRLGDLSDVFGVTDAAKAVGGAVATPLKRMLAGFSVGEKNFDTMMENPGEGRALMKSLYADGGSDYQTYHDKATLNQLGSVKDIADGARSTLSNIYGTIRNQLLSKVDSKFSADLSDTVFSAYSGALKSGIGQIEVRAPDVVKQGTMDYLTGKLTQEIVKGGVEKLTGTDAIEYLAKNGTKGITFSLLPQDQMKTMIAAGSKIGQGFGALASDNEAYGAMKGFYDSLSTFSGNTKRAGVEGAKDLLDFKKVSTDLADRLANSDAAQTPEVRSLINGARVAVDNSILNEFKKVGAADAFTELNSTYNSLSKNFSPILKAKARFDASGNMETFQPILTGILGDKGAVKRDAISQAIAMSKQYGLKEGAQALADSQLNIDLNEAAKAFNPIKPGYYKADNRNPIWEMGKGLAALPFTSVNGPKMAVATASALSQGKDLLADMTGRQLDQFLADPKMINSFVNGVMQAPVVRAKTDAALQGFLQQVSRPQGQAQPPPQGPGQ